MKRRWRATSLAHPLRVTRDRGLELLLQGAPIMTLETPLLAFQIDTYSNVFWHNSRRGWTGDPVRGFGPTYYANLAQWWVAKSHHCRQWVVCAVPAREGDKPCAPLRWEMPDD